MKPVLLILIILSVFFFQQNQMVQVKSPDGNILVSFGITDTSLFYSVETKDTVLIEKSGMGFQIIELPEFGRNAEIISAVTTEINETWKPVYGERNEIVNHCNEAVIRLKENTHSGNEYEIRFRVYNQGVAFNYTFLSVPGNDSIHILKENTEFKLLENFDCWVSERAQSEIFKTQIQAVKKPVDRPVLVEAGKYKLAIGEAKLVDFSRMKLISGENENSMVATLDGEAVVKLPYTTPWRTIMVGNSESGLLANNFFYENLNDACAIKDVSWIKPGKVIREVTLTTQGGLTCVDFAAEHGIQYVEFDAGWYGPENDESSDATTITVDPKRSPGPLDLHKVIDYANSKNISIILYVNRRALERQIDTIFPLYQSWGIKGVKYGFVQVGSQKWTSWLHEAVKKAADYQLLVDIHDEYRPTGFSRTYPNLLTQEGIRGDEESISNEHALKTLFTRMLAGAGDNTICYFAPRVTEKMGGHSSQLAKAIMFYSPWQFLFWYDRPKNSADVLDGVPGAKGFIVETPELELYKNMPTVWDETRILEGKTGEFATIARRTGNDWFVGSLTAQKDHTVKIDFGFLNSGQKYEAVIYRPDLQSQHLTNIGIEAEKIDSKTIKEFLLAANTGIAIHIRKIN
jgi:alpha-glucosidase